MIGIRRQDINMNTDNGTRTNVHREQIPDSYQIRRLWAILWYTKRKLLYQMQIKMTISKREVFILEIMQLNEAVFSFARNHRKMYQFFWLSRFQLLIFQISYSIDAYHFTHSSCTKLGIYVISVLQKHFTYS